MQRPINRIQPVGPAQSYKTFEISAPKETHHREASCVEVGCQMQANGWSTVVDESSDLGQRQAAYIRTVAGRAYTATLGEEGGTVFEFPAGQECFSFHQTRIDRDEHFIVRGGDWRGNPRREGYVHDSADSWVDEFATHQDRIDKALNG